jgi:hypothetical protein
VNGSVPALVALRGIELDLNPRARLDMARVRAAYTSASTRVTRLTTSRRKGRLYVHVRVQIDDVRALPSVPGFAWSQYTLQRRGDLMVFEQTVGAAANRPVTNVGWDRSELIAFRIHLPSKIPFHNGELRRGNILVWEQPLIERSAGQPLKLEAHMEPESILYRTLWLFGLCFIGVAAAFALVIWLIARKGPASVESEAA